MKHKIKFMAILMLIAYWTNASGQGIQFETGKTWKAVLAQAKAEHKFIFVDCYATWCGPCKEMDRVVYSNDSVGNYINSRFISVKMQFDTSKNDNDGIKQLYADAHQLMMVDYKVHAFPTFLFFDEKGRIVYRAEAYKKPAEFINVAKQAFDSSYYTRLADYQSGKKDYSRMAQLAITAEILGQEQFAYGIAADYLHNHMDKQTTLSNADIDFLARFVKIVSTNDLIFKIATKQPALLDSLRFKGYAAAWVNFIIIQEDITPKTDGAQSSGKEPDWAELQENITHKYSAKYAGNNVINARINWYRSRKDAANYSKYLTIQTEHDFQFGNIQLDLLGEICLNNTAMEIFNYDNNREDLFKALSWVTKLNISHQQPDAADLDTEASLLYKLGRKDEALKMELQAVTATPKDKAIVENFEKMKKGKRTWPDKMP